MEKRERNVLKAGSALRKNRKKEKYEKKEEECERKEKERRYYL